MRSRGRLVLSWVAVVVLVAMGAAEPASAEPLLKDGDRMVFLGDSITQQRIYTRYVMDFFALRYPEMEVAFRNAGVGGDTAVGAIKRLNKDVLELRPSVVSICFGMNDGGYTRFEEERHETFMAAMTVLLADLRRAGAKVVLLTPGPVDPDRGDDPAGMRVYNETLACYAQGVKELARAKGLPVYDIHTLMLDVQTRARADDPQFTMIPDSVHPSAPGQALMAYALLKALGCEGKASGLEIDGRTGAVQADRCAVDNLRVSPSEVTFTRKDKALPTYFDPEAAAVFRYTPIMEELNEYRFRVVGLQAGSWRLTAEDLEVGTFTAEELAAGVNLARRPGPWQVLGKAVNDLVAEQENIYLQKRQLAGVFSWIAPPPPEAEVEKLALMRKLDEAVQARENSMRRLVGDRTWEWRLTRTP